MSENNQTKSKMPRRRARSVDSATKSDPNVMQIEGDPSKREELLAGLTAEGLYTNAVLMKTFSSKIAGEIGITEAVQSLRATLTEVHKGDLKAAETMLLGQAAALNAIFAECARRAAVNMGQYVDATDRYMRLALKAQGQCRATLETLAAIKNPPVVFARQANINNGGQQQVNNGTPPLAQPPVAHAAEMQSLQSKLLENSHGERMDTGTKSTAGRTDQDMEAVEAVHRPAKRKR